MYLHCAAGVRVHRAAPLLEGMGFLDVVPLSEGFGELASIGFAEPVFGGDADNSRDAPW